jgi:hypothetical protein
MLFALLGQTYGDLFGSALRLKFLFRMAYCLSSSVLEERDIPHVAAKITLPEASVSELTYT